MSVNHRPLNLFRVYFNMSKPFPTRNSLPTAVLLLLCAFSGLRESYTMSTLDVTKLPAKKIQLKKYELKQLADALQNGLEKNFFEVAVEITSCPDLSLAPFKLSTKGLGGKTTVLQVGDPQYVVPTSRPEKIYDFKDVAKLIGAKRGCILGAGAGSWPYVGHLPEMFANVTTDGDVVKGYTTNTFVIDEQNGTIKAEMAPVNETRFSLLGSLFHTEGFTTDVIKVSCKRRIGEQSFSVAVRESLNSTFDDPIALGMVFQMLSGSAKHHVPPGFAKNVSSSELLNWLKLIDLEAPLISVGTIVTKNPPGVVVQFHHFHSLDARGVGGHYHYDTTPEIVEYTGYILPADTLWVVDQAENSGQLFE